LVLPDEEVEEPSILSHKWHEYSDDVIHATLSSSESSSHTAIRALSSALSKLSRVCVELEENHRILQQKEDARRKRAEELIRELQPSERDVAKRVIQSIFTDDDERVHQVRRQQSRMVSRYQMDLSLVFFDPYIVEVYYRVTHRGHLG
jgi:hypothetical protein